MTGPTVTLSNPGGVHPPAGWYHHLARVEGARLLFLAGQVGLDQDGKLAGNGEVNAQLHQAYRNIGKVLESAGASFDSIVQLTTYVVGRESVQPYLDARTELYSEIYPTGNYPPNTLLVISGLIREEMLVAGYRRRRSPVGCDPIPVCDALPYPGALTADTQKAPSAGAPTHQPLQTIALRLGRPHTGLWQSLCARREAVFGADHAPMGYKKPVLRANRVRPLSGSDDDSG